MKCGIEMAKTELGNMVTQYTQKDDKGNYCVDCVQRLPVMLLGPAGIGKTQIVGEVAKEKKIGLVSYSMVNHTRQSLLGLPVIMTLSDGKEEIKDTEYTLSEVLGTVYREVDKGYKEGILLLDEANCCTETIQPVLLSFLQSKTLGTHQLPEGWMMVLCGNPPRSKYNRQARQWDGALMDRIRVIELGTKNEEFLDYAYSREMHPVVCFYLALHPDESYICEEKEGHLDLVTYRTWENLSNALYHYERLGLEVTPIMVNEYIKVDNIVVSFFELYQYSRVNPKDYEELFQKMKTGNMDVSMINELQQKSLPIVYGITSFCFRQIGSKASELLHMHEALKDMKQQIVKNKVDTSAWAKDSRIPSDLQEDIGDNMDKNACIAFYDHAVERLRNDKEELMGNLENFMSEMDELNLGVLTEFYYHSVCNAKSWMYIMAGTKHPVMDQLGEDLKGGLR